MINKESLWKNGRITISTDGGEVLYAWEAKVYDEGSKYGINGGRVSKLQVRQDGAVVCNYDRGWDMKPESYAVEQVVNYIVDVVYADSEPSVHRDFVCYLINDWLEAEFNDADTESLQELVRKVGVSRLYELYMYSEESICTHDELTEMITNLLERNGYR